MLELFIHLLPGHLPVRGKVIVPAINDHLFWPVRIDDLPGIMDDIVQGRTAESAVDDRIAGKISLYTGPFAEGGAPHEKNGVGRWMLKTIPPFKFGYFVPERRLGRQSRLGNNRPLRR